MNIVIRVRFWVFRAGVVRSTIPGTYLMILPRQSFLFLLVRIVPVIVAFHRRGSLVYRFPTIQTMEVLVQVVIPRSSAKCSRGWGETSCALRSGVLPHGIRHTLVEHPDGESAKIPLDLLQPKLRAKRLHVPYAQFQPLPEDPHIQR